MTRPIYSFVIPVFNEATVIGELARRLQDVMERLDGDAEVVFVDDGSTDNSNALMARVRAADDRFKILTFSRNFGHQIAITAGLDFAAGDAVIIMDADLQDPPEVALELARAWREGFEVVYAVRTQREGESWFKRATARLFYRLFRRMTNVDAPTDAGDFRLIDRAVVDAIGAMREGNRYMRGMFSWIGFRQTGVPYARAARHSGETKYSLPRMIRFAADGVLSFSGAPLRLALRAGLLISTISFLAGIVAFATKLAGVLPIPGWASLMVLTAFLGGTQLIILGLMGEYIAQIHIEVKQRPLYVVRSSAGLDRSRAASRAVVALELEPEHER